MASAAEPEMAIVAHDTGPPPDEPAAAAAKTKRRRTQEYEQNAVAATLGANPATKEAQVWSKLQGKSRVMINMRKQFMEEFGQKGFGFVEGSKWTTHINEETYDAEDSHKTYAQILQAEAGCIKSAKAKLEFAKTMGEGTPDDPKGWFADPTRDGEPVYFYQENVRHNNKIGRHQGRQTMNSTGKVAIGDANAGVVPPAAGGKPVVPTTPTQTAAHVQTPLPLVPGTPTQTAVQTPASTAKAPTTPGACSLSSEPLATPHSSSKEQETVKPQETVDELMDRAQELCNQLRGLEMMSGFCSQLQDAIKAVKSVTGVPKSNYRCVRQLILVTNLTEKVYKVYDEFADG